MVGRRPQRLRRCIVRRVSWRNKDEHERWRGSARWRRLGEQWWRLGERRWRLGVEPARWPGSAA
ncbi:uncharacterized protein SOCEGT47_067710 [Sorangium cellulosum]|uniref:Uncharacterized protein n=1 Tax=Sorangium cellulosum TaxID=56 RepID=A0A4P2Q9F5_SORCE|nr:uncharacterized protein SOCEGT47_067710 [Sorangium cellulosum]